MLRFNQLFICSFFGLLTIGCQEEVRVYPVVYENDTFIKNSTLRGGVLLAAENKAFELYQQNSKLNFTKTGNGTFMSNLAKPTSKTAKTNDLVKFTYKISDLKNQTIYNYHELGIQKAVLGKTNLIAALHSSLFLIEPMDSAVILVPSSLAYGYQGDRNKISPNQALVITAKVLEIKRSN